jgi:hypothetical protein
MSDLDQWEGAEERIAAALRHGQQPEPEDLRVRNMYEKEWEQSYPIAAGCYAHGDEGGR